MTKEIKPELVHVGDRCRWFDLMVKVKSTYSDQTCDVITESGGFMPDVPQQDLEEIA